MNFSKHIQVDAFYYRVLLRKKRELLVTHANYVQQKSFSLHQYQSIAYVAASASSEMQTISVEKKKNSMNNVASAACAIGSPKVGVSHSMGHLCLRHFSKKRKMMK